MTEQGLIEYFKNEISMNHVTPSVVLKQLISTHTKGFGICKNFENICGGNLDLVMHHWEIRYEGWPGFSGSNAYPVKGVGMRPESDEDAVVTYRTGHDVKLGKYVFSTKCLMNFALKNRYYLLRT